MAAGRGPRASPFFSPPRSSVPAIIRAVLLRIRIYCRSCMRFLEFGPDVGPCGGLKWIERCDWCTERQLKREQELARLEELWPARVCADPDCSVRDRRPLEKLPFRNFSRRRHLLAHRTLYRLTAREPTVTTTRVGAKVETPSGALAKRAEDAPLSPGACSGGCSPTYPVWVTVKPNRHILDVGGRGCGRAPTSALPRELLRRQATGASGNRIFEGSRHPGRHWYSVPSHLRAVLAPIDLG